MTSLAHVNIRTSCLEESLAFYRDVIGLVPRAAATRRDSAHHVWMSDRKGRPCVHLQRSDARESECGERIGVHHVAFETDDPTAWREKLKAQEIEFTETEFADAKLLQFNLTDPNAVRLELLFGSK